MAFPFKLLSRAIIASGVSVATGAIKSLTIADATAIDPQSSIGASGSGWVAIVVLKGITSLVGTVVPSALTLTVSDPGYDTSGGATTVNRTITGVAHLRRQYPNGANKMISTDAVDLTLYITLDDWIYSGTSILTASIGSTFYTSCVASSAPTKTNLSTETYKKPLFSWLNTQNEIAGSTLAVEGVAYHRSAMAGQQVACVKYRATDGTNFGTVSTVSTPTLSTKITAGNTPECWAASVDFSTLTQAALCTVNAQIYPWLGDSTAIMDLSVSGTAWPTPLPLTKLRAVCDRTGGYGGAYAYVDGVGSAPAVNANPVTAKTTPYANITAALAAIKVWNNANKGHNDFGGAVIRIMDNAGSPRTQSIASAATNDLGAGQLIIEKDPASAVAVTVTPTVSFCQMPENTVWRNLKLVTGATIPYNFIGFNTAWGLGTFNGCTLDNTNNVETITYYDLTYYLNCVFTGSNQINLRGNTNAGTSGIVMIAGSSCTTDILLAGCDPQCWIGNNINKSALQAATISQGCDGTIISHNKFQGALSMVFTPSATFTYGVANVQNLYETSAGAAGIAMNFFSDGDTSTISNYVEMHNTAVGARCSRMYNDVAGTKVIPNGKIKRGVSRYNIWNDYNIKMDTFGAGLGSVGGFPYTYSVGNAGNVNLFGDVQQNIDSAPHNDNTDTPYLGNAWLPSSVILFATSTGLTTKAAVMALFTSYTAGPQGSPASGGNYKPLSGATLIKSRVPTGLSALKYDITGTLRRTDGTGAAGAYESA